MKVDILMATYNGEKYLREQIDSILNQTFKEFNLIICDDCSKDSTWEILEEYQKKDNRIKIIKNENNLGYNKNFEKLLNYVEADYFMLSDQDDFWLENKVEESYKKITSEGLNLVCSDLEVVDENLKTIYPSMWEFWPDYNIKNKIKKSKDYRSCLMTNCITGCTTIVNSKLIPKLIPLPGDPIIHDWWIGLVAGADKNIGYIEKPLIKYRQHGNNQIGYVTTKMIYKFSSALRKHWINNHIQILEVLQKRRDVLNPDLENVIKEGIDYLKSILDTNFIVLKNKTPFKNLYKYEDDKYIKQISLMYNYPFFAKIYRVFYVIKVKLFDEKIGVKNLIKKIIKTYMPFIYKPIHEKRMKNAMNEEGALTYNYDVNEDDYKAMMNQLYSNFEKPEKKDTFVAYNREKYKKTDKDIKIITHYLPQFHTFPENEEWWGKGFTEWNNVTKAMPHFVGQRQPKLPHDIGFYDLSQKENIKKQIELAKQYGIYGFSIYYYWFDNHRLMEKPLDIILENKDLDINFCINWANENWTKRWDGGDKEILMAQTYDENKLIDCIKDMEKYIRDERYIKVDGKPLIIVYKPTLIPNVELMIENWRKYLRDVGIGEAYIMAVKTFDITDKYKNIFDGFVEFPPFGMEIKVMNNKLKFFNKEFKGVVYDYKRMVDEKTYLRPFDHKLYRGIFPAWDNSARRQFTPDIFWGSTPELYETWLSDLAEETIDNDELDDKIIFVNAWNEWAEGACLEPDRDYGYAYIQATRNVLEKYKKD